MAIPSHLNILKQGVEVWNTWRKDYRYKPNLSGAILNRENLRGVNFSETDLSKAKLWAARIGHADLFRANLREADLGEAVIVNTDLTSADLSGANLSGAILNGSTFTNAVLNGANFTEARLSYTTFGDSDLSLAKGLDTVIQYGPSTIGIDAIYKSRGHIPEMFLRGAGVPEEFITYARSLINKAIDFYSCFISYSSKDQSFAERLRADLLTEGVRCWFAPEDLKIGEPFRQRIDESIRLHDKLLVVLSESSVSSPWVKDEVESALERERRENHLVLFPIRIDNAVIDTDGAWAASLRRTRHIGDFTEWKSQDNYQKAFERLLRDLKAGQNGE